MLDLGAGTRLLARFVVDAFPGASLVLVDIAGDMLTRARDRFAGVAAEVRFLAMDYAAEPLPAGPFDAVVSALSIHHVGDPAKRALFARIFGALRPGGVFVNADQVAGPTPELDARCRGEWLARVRAGGAAESTISATLARMEHDRCAPIADQLAWLAEAGFANVDLPFKDGMFAVMTGERAS